MKKGNFGITLLKVFVIALVFGIVAASAFEGMAYFLGDKLGLSPIMIGQPWGAPSEGEKAEELPEREAATEEEESPKEEESTSSATTTQVRIPAAAISDADLVEAAMPSIVAITNISTVQYSTFWGERGSYESESAGSGFLVKEDGESLYIVTNEHVIKNAERLIVQFLDEETAEGSIRGTDSSRDIAVVEVKKADIPEETLGKIKVAVLGDSKALRVGESAIAIGNALGYGISTTKGVISALDREVTVQDESTGISITNFCIQTDAAINPGNSGGALLNESGEVIGINEIKYSRTDVEGIGYAIPMATAKPIIDQLIENGQVSARNGAFLGIQGVEIDETDSQKYGMPMGVYLVQVVPGSAAEQAGLQAGDIITEFDGKAIHTQEELSAYLSRYAAGDKLEITFYRANQGVYREYVTEAILGSRND